MTISNQIDKIIDSMPIELKIGQLFLLAYPGKDPQKIYPLIEKFGISGCYISQDNAETFTEAKLVTESLQELAKQTPHQLPLILGVDQEGAWGVLVPESNTGPGNLALGVNSDPHIAYEIYRVFGLEMLSVGYNALLSPCADLNADPRSPIIGTRSFGDDPDSVAELVSLAVQGASSTGIVTTLKHFPGHGDTHADSHREIPYVNKNLNTLLTTDLLPFSAGIKAGADMVMTSHICFPQVDADNPATLSKKILVDILRDKLEFSGVVLSDSMNMGAIRRFYDPADSTVAALKAGVDIIMLAEEHYDHSQDYFQKQLNSLEKVHKAVIEGYLTIEEIDAKLRRIISLKYQRLYYYRNEQAEFTSLIPKSTRQEIATRAAVGAVKILRDDNRILPITLDNSTVCINATPRIAYNTITNIRGIGPNQSLPAFDSFKETLTQANRGITFLEMHQVNSNRSVLASAKSLIIVTEDYPLPGEDMDKTDQHQFVRECINMYGKKTVVVGLRSPHELLEYPIKPTYICAYSSRTCSAVATAQMMLDGSLTKT